MCPNSYVTYVAGIYRLGRARRRRGEVGALLEAGSDLFI